MVFHCSALARCFTKELRGSWNWWPQLLQASDIFILIESFYPFPTSMRPQLFQASTYWKTLHHHHSDHLFPPHHHHHFDHPCNRNFNNQPGRVWCYTTDPKVRSEPCFNICWYDTWSHTLNSHNTDLIINYVDYNYSVLTVISTYADHCFLSL